MLQNIHVFLAAPAGTAPGFNPGMARLPLLH